MTSKRYSNDIDKNQIHGKENIKTGAGAASTAFVEGGSNAVSASFFYGDGSQLTGISGIEMPLDELTVDSTTSIQLSSSLNSPAAIQVLASAGGIDIDAVGAAGEDISITNTGGSINIRATEDSVAALNIFSNSIFFNGGDQDDSYLFFHKPIWFDALAVEPDPTTSKLWQRPLGTLNWANDLEVGGTITTEGTVQNNLQVGSHRQVIAVDQDIRFADNATDTVIVEVDIKIPARAIITMVSAAVKTLSNLGTHKVNIQMSATSGTGADSAISSGTELLGAGAIGTMSTDSASASDISLGSSAALKDVWLRHVALRNGTSDQYIYICNAGTGNGTTNSEEGTLSVVVEYYGMD